MVLEQDRIGRQVGNKRPIYTDQEDDIGDSDDSGILHINQSKYVD